MTVASHTSASPPQAATQRAGITADGLVERITRQGVSRLDPSSLERWLVTNGLAQLDGDRLLPTQTTITLACVLDP